jgi:hypothetical protein
VEGVLLRYVIPGYVAVAVAVVGIVVSNGLGEGLAPGASNGCSFHVGAAVAGDEDLFLDEVASACPELSPAGAAETILWDVAFALVYGTAGTALLLWLWPRAWRISLLRVRLRWLAGLPAFTAVLDLLENSLILAALPDGGPVLRLGDPAATVAAVFGWWKWTFGVPACAVLAAAVCGALGHLRTPPPPSRAAPAPPPPPPVRGDTGICLGGPGIRSAAFSLGALRALDRWKVFGRARWLAGTAGGAYAAGAWSVARGDAAEAPGVRPQPAGGVDGLLDPPRGAPDLVAYVRAHRRYLAGGRGGLPATVVVAALMGALNLLVLAAPVVLLAWPVGRLVSSWAVQPALRSAGDVTIPDRLLFPGVAGLAAGALLLVVSLFLWDPARRRLVAAAEIAAGGGTLLLILLAGLPAAIADVPPESPRWFALVVGAGFAATAVRAAAAPPARLASLAGAALLVLLAAFLAWEVASGVARGDGVFAWTPRGYGAAAATAALFYVVATPASWAWSRLRYFRLRTTFATTQDPGRRARGAPATCGVYPRSLAGEAEWPAYRGRPGPKLLVCATARRSGLHPAPFTLSVESGHHLVLLRRPGPWGPRLGSVSAALALSGAAAAPGAALAAVNLRSGAWMPNPRYARPGAPRPLKRARAGYLLKEVAGIYDPDDPYVAGAPGWDDLGLLELLRRRCRWIFCIDASGSFDALTNARVAALAECRAEIDLDLSALRPRDGTLPARSTAVGVVRYHDCRDTGRDGCEIGLLFYARELVAADASVNTLSFSLRSRRRTRDAFLSGDQFDDYVRLGHSAGRRLALEYGRLAEAIAASAPERLAGSPALAEAYERLVR